MIVQPTAVSVRLSVDGLLDLEHANAKPRSHEVSTTHGSSLAAAGSPTVKQIAYRISMSEIQHILREFLEDTSYRSPQTPQNPTLHEAVTAEIVSWNIGLGWDFVIGLSETSAVIAECAYAHVSYEHQLLIAIVTALVVYADDVGQHNVEAVGGFVQRFSAGERQLDPVFDRLADVLRSLDDLYPRISADAIVTSILEYFTGTYIELTTKDEVISPAAVRYPHYLRLKTGIPSAYANMNFTKAWAEASGPYYLQVLP